MIVSDQAQVPMYAARVCHDSTEANCVIDGLERDEAASAHEGTMLHVFHCSLTQRIRRLRRLTIPEIRPAITVYI